MSNLHLFVMTPAPSFRAFTIVVFLAVFIGGPICLWFAIADHRANKEREAIRAEWTKQQPAKP